jgi:hypothetical protein
MTLVLRPWLVPPLLVQFPFNIALRSSIVEETPLDGEPNEYESWHQRKDEQAGQHMLFLPFHKRFFKSFFKFFQRKRLFRFCGKYA